MNHHVDKDTAFILFDSYIVRQLIFDL